MNPNQRVLLLATSSYAGMGPYVISIVNSFKPDDNIRIYLMDVGDDYFRDNLKPELIPITKIIKYPYPNIFQRFLQVVTGKEECRNDVLDYIKQEKIDIVHPLSQIVDLKLIKRISKMSSILLTIHDLFPHCANKAFYKEWRQKKLYDRIFKSIKYCKYLNTNSIRQLEEQKKLYPKHIHSYTNFPTLVTDSIKNGKKIPTEISNLKNYILFFGRIEAYKGIDILIEAFKKIDDQLGVKLIIAGKGDFNRSEIDNVIYINRYIDDEEIAYLYKNAACVVYPYISATQSGVLSIASYFNTPIICSDIPYFKEILGSDYALLFNSKDSDSLSILLKNFFKSDSVKYKCLSGDLYFSHYSSDSTRKDLLSIYNKISLSTQK